MATQTRRKPRNTANFGFSRLLNARLPMLATAMILLGLISLTVDQWLVANFSLADLPGDVRSSVKQAEVFGHGFGVVIVIITLILLARPSRGTLLTLVGCSFGAGLMANLFKLLVARIRPHSLSRFDGMESWNAFVGVFPFRTKELTAGLDSALQSFPSAHTATAVGLALCLGHLYPRGKYWFLFLAALVGVQRISAHAHYASDVFFGAALSMIWCSWILSLQTRKPLCDSLRTQQLEKPSAEPLHLEQQQAA